MVEDEESLRDAIVSSLRFTGFDVTSADTGRRALRLARERTFDLIVIDETLPDLNGFEIRRQLRRDAARVPIIFLAAPGTKPDVVAGVSIGGDDCITKPFGLDDLAFRIRRVLRRTGAAVTASLLTFADVELNQDTYEVRRGGRLCQLSPTEFRLLRYLMLNPGRVLPRRELLDHVWNYDHRGSPHILNVYIGYLRRKLLAYGPDLIHTQPSAGYMLRRPDDDPAP